MMSSSALKAILKGLAGKNVDAVLGFSLFFVFVVALAENLDRLFTFVAMVAIYGMYLVSRFLRDRSDQTMARIKLTDTREKRRLALEQKGLLVEQKNEEKAGGPSRV